MLALLLAVAALPPIVSVPDLVDHAADFQGKIVDVRGWMGECQPLGCFIHATQTGAGNHMLDPDHHEWVSIGAASRDFDKKATTLRGKFVGIRDRFDGTCLDDKTTVCLDRASELQPKTANSLFLVKDH